MTRTGTVVSLFIAFAITPGCDGASPQDRSTLPDEAEHHDEGGEHHHEGEAPGPVADFHSVLSPLWHADPGPDRTESTCTAAGDLRAKAAAIVGAPVPGPASQDEAGWRLAATTLRDSVDALGAACAEAGRPTFEERFSALHEAFHHLHERLEPGDD